LRDLFQVVFEMKKKEMEEKKAKSGGENVEDEPEKKKEVEEAQVSAPHLVLCASLSGFAAGFLDPRFCV
jgi:hypothetical protein